MTSAASGDPVVSWMLFCNFIPKNSGSLVSKVRLWQKKLRFSWYKVAMK